MLIAPNSLPTYIATGGNEVNYGVASIPSNTGESVSAGVMDRFMCFDNDYSDDEKAAISTFFDYFYDDARYTEWVDMEGFLPATKTASCICHKKVLLFCVANAASCACQRSVNVIFIKREVSL